MPQQKLTMTFQIPQQKLTMTFQIPQQILKPFDYQLHGTTSVTTLETQMSLVQSTRKLH